MTQQMESAIVPTIDVEWDSTFFGGNYSRIDSSTTQIPVAFVKKFGSEEEAFERFTHIHRCHIVSVAPEESEAYGHEKNQERLNAEQGCMLAFAKEHTPVCAYCENLAQQLRKEQAHEQIAAEWDYDMHCRCRLCRAFEVSQQRNNAIAAFHAALVEKPEFLRLILGQEKQPFTVHWVHTGKFEADYIVEATNYEEAAEYVAEHRLEIEPENVFPLCDDYEQYL